MRVFEFVLLALLVFTGCKSDMLPADLVQWVRNSENGLRKTKEVGDLKVEVLYKPYAYQLANNFRSNDINADQYFEKLKKLEGLQYFDMKLSVKGDKATDITRYRVANETELQERLYYLSFPMKDDITLVEGTDTLSCALFHFERSYDLADHRTFVLAFESNNNEKVPEDKTFIFDSPYFGTGPLKFRFQKKDIERIPQIKLLP